MTSTRRDFLIGGLSAGAALPLGAKLAPQWLQAAGSGAQQKKLVILQINGGWDLFNQIVPVNMPVYYAARPTNGIGIPDSATTTLEIAASIPQKWAIFMRGFKDLYDRGDLAVINGFGYPNPNLSHFESELKYYQADPAASILTEGWLSRYLRLGYTGGFQVPAMDFQGRLVGAFVGSRVPVFTSPTAFGYQYDTNAISSGDNATEHATLKQNAMVLRQTPSPNLRYLAEGTAGAVNDSALVQTSGANYTPRVTYPATTLARDLQLAARYITGGLATHVFYLSTGGFDNHANIAVAGAAHTGTFANLMTNVTNCVKAFLDDMAAYSRSQDVVVMLFSEFSRRFGQNGSIGTDHGHGSVCYLAGDPVVGGWYGTYPDLNLATQPYANYYPRFDPATSIDFRRVYATVIEKWFGTPSAPILGQQFQLIPAL
jgi:uncharacterized protein (DUF1501 family)